MPGKKGLPKRRQVLVWAEVAADFIAAAAVATEFRRAEGPPKCPSPPRMPAKYRLTRPEGPSVLVLPINFCFRLAAFRASPSLVPLTWGTPVLWRGCRCRSGSNPDIGNGRQFKLSPSPQAMPAKAAIAAGVTLRRVPAVRSYFLRQPGAISSVLGLRFVARALSSRRVPRRLLSASAVRDPGRARSDE